MGALHAATFWCAALIFVARTPSVRRNPRGRAAWAATGVGALGLLTLGSVVPQPVLDGWLGGTNLVNLVQNVCATTAFWLMLRASTGDLPRRPVLAHPLALLAMVTAFTIPFACITDRGTTAFHFIVLGIDQTAMWLYASVYMACVAAITVTTLVRGMPTGRGALGVFRVGLVLVTLASVEEIVSLTADHLGLATPGVRDALRFAFDPPFYLGIVLVVVGMASFTVRRWVRDLRLGRHRRRLARVVRHHGLRPVDRRADLRVRTYDLVIAIRDAEVQGRTIDPGELAHVRSAERLLARNLGG